MPRFGNAFLLSRYLVNDVVGCAAASVVGPSDTQKSGGGLYTEVAEPKKRKLMRREPKRKHQSRPPSTDKEELVGQAETKQKIGDVEAQAAGEPDAKVKAAAEEIKRAKALGFTEGLMSARLDQAIADGQA